MQGFFLTTQRKASDCNEKKRDDVSRSDVHQHPPRPGARKQDPECEVEIITILYTALSCKRHRHHFWQSEDKTASL